jgi:hypothetical protein
MPYATFVGDINGHDVLPEVLRLAFLPNVQRFEWESIEWLKGNVNFIYLGHRGTILPHILFLPLHGVCYSVIIDSVARGSFFAKSYLRANAFFE